MQAGWDKDVLNFWFNELTPEQWFSSSEELDNTIKQRFGSLLDALTQQVPDTVRENVKTTLAAIIVLDQFSRNLGRGSSAAFANDDAALVLAQAAVDAGEDEQLTTDEKHFLYMPFMHAENMEAQDRSVALFEAIDRAEHAVEHRDIVVKFGRYPHRNEVLGRESTPEEIEYLKDARRFGQ